MVTSVFGDFLTPLSFHEPPAETPADGLAHAPILAWLVEAARPTMVVDASPDGAAFVPLCEAVRALDLPARCVALDAREAASRPRPAQDSDPIVGWAAGSPSTLAPVLRGRPVELLESFAAGSIDLAHVEAEASAADLDELLGVLLPKLSERGVLILRGDLPGEHAGGDLWDRVRQLPAFDFAHGRRLRVVAVGAEVPSAVRALTALQGESAEADLVRAVYQRLGQTLTGRDLACAATAAEAALTAARERHTIELASAVRQAQGRENALLGRLRERDEEVRTATHLTRTQLRKLVRARLRAEGVRLLGSDVPDEAMRVQLAALFDAAYYAAQHPELSQEDATFDHYLAFGWPAAESPTPLFDADWYATVNPDVVSAGWAPLPHYLVHGDAEGRDPNAVLDVSWYRVRHPDLFEVGDLALARYATEGHRLGHDPSPAFRTHWYLERYPEVALSGRNALADYLTDGALRGRDPHPEFDTAWYVATHSDIDWDGTNPLVHYLTYGLEEGRATTPSGDHLCRN